MSLINTMFPPFREFLQLFGIGEAVLGRSRRFQTGIQSWNPQNYKTVLIDMSMGQLMNIAQNVPHLNIVISKGAEMFSNMQIRHLGRDGKAIEKSPVLELLHAPNPIQTLENFLYEYYIFHSVYNQEFIYKNMGAAFNPVPNALWNIPGGWIKINLTGKMYDQVDIEGIVKDYVLVDNSKIFAPKDMIHIAQGVGLDCYRIKTTIESLQIPLSNIIAALKSNNIILTERGMIGFVSHEGSNDAAGAMPPDREEMLRMSKQYKEDRSLDAPHGHVGFTHANVKWVPLSFNMDQLQIFTGLKDAFGNICDAYGIDPYIFASSDRATYENKVQGLRHTYQNTMQPLADMLMRRLSKNMGLTERGERLEADYSWMPIMKADELKSAQTLKARTESVSMLVQNNIVNPSEGRIMLDKLVGTPIEEVAISNPVLEGLMDLSPLLANNVLGNLTINEVRGMLGLGPIEGGEALAKTSGAQPAPTSQGSGTQTEE
jgi:hypothetical protein